MKRIFYLTITVVSLGFLFSCEPIEDGQSLPAITLTPDQLNFTVVQNPTKNNEVKLTNLDSAVIPYWSYSDANGEIGHYNTNEQIVFFPFAGTYTVNYTALTPGGSVYAKPVSVTVDQNDPTYFSEPEWNDLTNGEAGKTWVLDMANPIGWAGLDYPYNTSGGDYWNWFPDYGGNSWVMANKNWGEMTFDLNGGYHVKVVQTALNSDDQTTKSGLFNLDIAKHTIAFAGGPELLHGGDYYPDVSNWKNMKVVLLTADALELSVIRDQSRSGEGVCQIVYRYKVKPGN